MRIPTFPSMESATNAVSVSAWVKPDSNGQWQAIARKVLQDSAHNYPYAAYDLLIEEVNGIPKARMAVSTPSGARGVVYGNTALTYGQWYHLAGVYDGAAIVIYVNGSQDGTVAFSGSIVQTNQPLLIGRNGAEGDIFKGVLDDFRLYNRALTAAEVQTLSTPGLVATLDLRRSDGKYNSRFIWKQKRREPVLVVQLGFQDAWVAPSPLTVLMITCEFQHPQAWSRRPTRFRLARG